MKPNFLIVGVNKAGTTSLYYYLKQHPDVFMSKLKEPHFFASEDLYGDCSHLEPIIRKWEDYVKLFKGAEKFKIVGEASTSYFHSPSAPFKIKKILGKSVKIMVILRDPVERAFSQWKMDFANGWTQLDFLEAVKKDYFSSKKDICSASLYIEFGLYYEKVVIYKNLFGNNFKVLFFEEFRKNPEKVLKDVFHFSNIKYIKINPEKYNVSGIPRNSILKKLYQSNSLRKIFLKILNGKVKNRIKKYILKNFDRKITKEEREYLLQFFIEDIEKLEKFLNVDLSHWKKVCVE